MMLSRRTAGPARRTARRAVVVLRHALASMPQMPSNLNVPNMRELVQEEKQRADEEARRPDLSAASLSLPIVSFFDSSKTHGDVELEKLLWARPVNSGLVHRAVVHETTMMHLGVYKGKKRAEVKASGRKLHRQKGTGMARARDAASPIRRGGGRAHAPRVRDRRNWLNNKEYELAIAHVLADKYQNGMLTVVDDERIAEEELAKTARVRAAVAEHGWDRVMVVGSTIADPLFDRASRNLQHVDYMPQQELACYPLLRFKHLVLSREALDIVQERFLA